jgi:hypothetical protein
MVAHRYVAAHPRPTKRAAEQSVRQSRRHGRNRRLVVPRQAPNPTDQPNVGSVPWSAETDASFPDDWIYPDNQSPALAAAPSTTPPPSPQPNPSPAVSNRPAARFDPFAAYWSQMPASRVGALAWEPPIFPDSFGQFPSAAPAPYNDPPNFPPGGLLGGIGRMIAAAQARASDPLAAATNGILGGIPKLIPAAAPTSAPSIDAAQGLLAPLANFQLAPWNAQADASYLPELRSFMSPEPSGYQGGGPLPGVVLVADKKTDKRDLDLFDEMAFGQSPPLGSTAPRLIPPFGDFGPRPSSPPQHAPPAQTPALPTPPRGSGSALRPLTLGAPGTPAPSLDPIGEAAKSDAVARGVSSSTPIEEGGQSPASSRLDWGKLAEGIKDAISAGLERFQPGISAALPKYETGGATYGVLVTNEGKVVLLKSGDPNSLYSNYRPAGHVEGKAAVWIREHGSTGGVIYHNNTDGTCGPCHSQIETLLPQDAVLWVFPPPEAIAKNAWARQGPTKYKGDAAIPKSPPPNPQLNLFNGQQE